MPHGLILSFGARHDTCFGVADAGWTIIAAHTDWSDGKVEPIKRLLFSKHVAGWLDQAVVSASNLAVLLILARWGGIEHVGYYAVGFSILQLAVATQDSLVTRPYTIRFLDPPAASPAAHAGAALALSGLASAFLTCVLLALVSVWEGGREGWHVLLALAFATPPCLLREFARRYSFAHMAPHAALFLDLAVSVVTLVLLATIAWSGWLDGFTTLAGIGVATGLAGAVWFIRNRHAFAFGWPALGRTARQSISVGKWLLFGQLALQTQGYAASWIAMLVGGAQTAGLYAACLSIVALSNPFLFGYFNILTPKFVRILKERSHSGLVRQAVRDSLTITSVMLGFTTFIMVFGKLVMAMMYPGSAYQEGLGILAVLSLAATAGAIGGPAGTALVTAGNARSLALLSAVVCVAGSLAVWVLMLKWGLTAAAYGVLATELLASAARWGVLMANSRKVGRTSVATDAKPMAGAVS